MGLFMRGEGYIWANLRGNKYKVYPSAVKSFLVLNDGDDYSVGAGGSGRVCKGPAATLGEVRT